MCPNVGVKFDKPMQTDVKFIFVGRDKDVLSKTSSNGFIDNPFIQIDDIFCTFIVQVFLRMNLKKVVSNEVGVNKIIKVYMAI